MKKAWIFIFVFVVLAAGFMAWQRPFKQEKAGGPLEELTVANIGVFSVFNPVAEEKGFFRQQGLAVQVDEYDSGATSIAALLSGKADIAMAADFVGVTNAFQHDDLRVIAQVSSQDSFRLIARRDRNIRIPADLRGKKIGVTKRTAGEFYLGRFLIANNLRMQDVQTLDLPPAEMSARLEAGELDAVLIFEPHAYTLQEHMGNDVITWSAQGDQRALCVAYALQSFIDSNEDKIEAYLRALKQSEAYLNEDTERAKALTTTLLQYDKEYTEYMWPKFVFAVDLNQDLLLTMEEQASWMIANHLTDQTEVPNYLGYIHFDSLKAVDPSAVTIIY